MNSSPVNTVSHFIPLDYLANVEFILNVYAQGLSALGIHHTLVINPAAVGPAHPIPEENQKITSNLLRDLQTFKQITINKVNVHVVKAHINGSNIHFMIGYHEPS